MRLSKHALKRRRKRCKMVAGTKKAAHFFAKAFSAICFGRSNPVFSRHTSPIFIKSRNVSCSLKSSFWAQSFTLSSVVSAILTGMVLLNFSFTGKVFYFFADLLNTQSARSYLTRFKCSSPIRIVRRITSCILESVFSAACFNSSASKSDMRIVCTTIFLSSFIGINVSQNTTFPQSKKSYTIYNF